MNTSYSELRKDEMRRWTEFMQERFEPVSHLLMILFFVGGHYLMADASRFIILEPTQVFLVTIGVGVFFFKLRCYDELKDYDTDVEINPDRPLPRGLLRHNEVKRRIERCILVEVIIFTSCGSSAGFWAIAIAIGYSLLMYKEFFIPKLIGPHLTTYATSHTVVTFFVSVAIFSALSRYSPWQHHQDVYYFGLTSWLLFNIFELGRKTYQPSEEREGIDTYSSVWGKFGAFMLIFSQAALSSYFLLQISTIDLPLMKGWLIGSLSLLLLVGLAYLFTKKPFTGKLYRNFSSFYIVLIYGGVIAHYLTLKT
jgi:hypothetical protein